MRYISHSIHLRFVIPYQIFALEISVERCVAPPRRGHLPLATVIIARLKALSRTDWHPAWLYMRKRIVRLRGLPFIFSCVIISLLAVYDRHKACDYGKYTRE
jgi:hypothetical protein